MRKPKPWYWAYKKGWYVKVGGVQHPLGKHHEDRPPARDKKGEWKPVPPEVERAFQRLMAGEGLAVPQKGLPQPGLVEQFLADAARTCTPETVAWYRSFLDDFAGRYPRLKPEDIAPKHVRAWLDAERKRPWGQSTHRSAITVLKRLLNWAAENRLLAENPIRDMDRPAATRRERILTEEERAGILFWYPEGDPFRDFLLAMMESGAPQPPTHHVIVLRVGSGRIQRPPIVT